MKSRAFTIIIAAAGVALLSIVAPSISSGQFASGSVLSPQAGALIVELKAQNALLQEQQAHLDAKLADIAEKVRQARIWAARGGGKGGA